MNINILGYEIDLEILILIGIIYLIMIVHTLISVTKVEGVNEIIKEGFEAITNMNSSNSTINSSINSNEKTNKKSSN
jgi:hypothetical protein